MSSPAQAVPDGNIACSGGGYFRVVDNKLIAKETAENTTPNKCQGTAVVPEGVTEIGAYGLADEEFMTNVSLPNSLTKIGGNGLAGTKLTSINLPPNLLVLEQGALQYNGYLTTLVIPPLVSQIGLFMVFGAYGLCNVYFLGSNAPTVDSGTFAQICQPTPWAPGGPVGNGSPKAWVPQGATSYPPIGSDFGGLTVQNGGAIILFDANGADSGNIPATQSVSPNSSIQVPDSTGVGALVRANYRFIGWCTTKIDDGSGQCFTPGNSFVAPEGTTILYANWQGKPTVTYYGNDATGGNVPVDSSSPYEDNSIVTVIGNTGSLTRTGYTFGGWASAADGTGLLGATFNIGTSNAKLYAKWNADSYGLIYDRNWGSGSGTGNGTGPTPYVYDSTVTVADKPAGLTKTGYDFAGWNTKADGTGDDLLVGSTFTMGAENTTLYAKWSVRQYGVFYSGNGNTSGYGMGPNAHDFGSSVTVRDNENALAKTGYDFAGWNTKADGTGGSRPVGSTFTIGSENLELFAQWNPKSFYVSYDGNGSTDGTVPVDVLSPRNYGASVPVLSAGSLVKAGYRFIGWSTVSDGTGVPYLPAASFTLGDADVVLFAQWSNVAQVDYYTNGATKGTVPPDYEFTFGSTVTVSTNSGGLAKPGYKFVGWNTKADGSGTSYGATGSITFVMPEDEVSLYAMWKVVPAPNKPVVEAAAAPVVTFMLRFQYGSSALSLKDKNAIKKLVKDQGKDSNFSITGSAGAVLGVPSFLVRALATKRAGVIKAYLATLGVKKSNISVNVKVTRIREISKTEIKIS